MSIFKEYPKYDAIGLAELVRNREISANELIDEAITRIEKANPLLNAVVTKLYDEVKKEIDLGLPDGPFKGVPFLLKESEQYAGAPITFSSRYIVENNCEYDSEIVSRYKNSGLAILGKTNAPEFGLSGTTESVLFGPCRNPWDTNLSPGGSSGGTACAIASGMVPIGQGSDGGGSIRIPASCCGVVGMKTTRGRNPVGPRQGEIWSGLVVKNVLSKTVRDSAALLDVTAGPDVGAPYYVPTPDESFLSQTNKEPIPLKIAFSTIPSSGVKVDKECVDAVQNTLQLLEDMGHAVEEVKLNYIDDAGAYWKAFFVIMMANTQAAINSYNQKSGRGKPNHKLIEKVNWLNLQWGKFNSAVDLVESINILHSTGRKIAKLFEIYNVLVTPTLAQLPPQIGYLDSMDECDVFSQRAGEIHPFSSEFNVSGNPALSLPLHFTSSNIPVGVQFVGRYGDEATLFQIASALEKEMPWTDRYSYEYV